MKEIVRLEPVFKYRVWGGRKLKEYFGYDIPTDKTGECWAISAHKNGDCIIKNGEFKGKTLSWLYENHREHFGNIKNKEFPLLVKLIDASNDLSIQVHPNDEYAYSKENGQLGKTEAWYIIDCNEDTVLEYGHNANTKEELVNYIEEGKWKELLTFKPIKKGDFFYIPSGTVHAICKNTLIYEIQQSSDLTYRVYDYDRVDENTSEKRELHVEKAIDVIKVPFGDENNVKSIIEKKDGYVKTHYVNSEYFNTVKFDVKDKARINHKALFSLVTVIEGKGTLDGEEIKKGDNFVIPFGYNDFEINGEISFIVSSI
ncbi:mannose-6-phosphate isomerase, class I [Clostridium aciditolerans]|uniref:mannose-6-phosphate isomerase n=1 Tax=Clostridium aciditolerans TaxID=339861 RepID=A0A934M0S2_9CLOT|nr:mannose-6-phosphate isomerase, class I [Clostridium aciditolerans]MBI6872474.1 mannose-6-phosphate isomerase, class I [Clostridium aciditolerans]